MPRDLPSLQQQLGNFRGGNAKSQWRPQGAPPRNNPEPPKPSLEEMISKMLVDNEALLKATEATMENLELKWGSDAYRLTQKIINLN